MKASITAIAQKHAILAITQVANLAKGQIDRIVVGINTSSILYFDSTDQFEAISCSHLDVAIFASIYRTRIDVLHKHELYLRNVVRAARRLGMTLSLSHLRPFLNAFEAKLVRAYVQTRHRVRIERRQANRTVLIVRTLSCLFLVIRFIATRVCFHFHIVSQRLAHVR